MKRNILFAAVIALCTPFAIWAQDATFNAGTYNIRQLNKGDDRKGNGWEKRRDHVAELVRFHGFDIFGTQEGFKSQLTDLLDRLPGYAYIGSGRDDGKEGGEHSAIFYRTDLFDVLDHGDFWLSETPERPGLGWDAACVRICTWGKFRHKPSGKEFLLFNLHMDHIGTTARVESAKLIERRMAELGPELPVILTGDFNVDQHSDSYRTIVESGVLADTHELSPIVYMPTGSWNDYITNGYSTDRIDHVFVSPGVKVSRWGVLTDTYRDAPTAESEKSADGIALTQTRHPSDHFPVLVTLTL